MNTRKVFFIQTNRTSLEEVPPERSSIKSWSPTTIIQTYARFDSKIKAHHYTPKRSNISHKEKGREWIRLINSIEKTEGEYSEASYLTRAQEVPEIKSNPELLLIISELRDAIHEHNSARKLDPEIPTTSYESIKRLLYITPTLRKYSPRISVNPANGFLSITISKEEDCIFTASLGDDGKIPYSLAGKGEKIFKITGCAKFKTEFDHLNFIRVLKSIWT